MKRIYRSFIILMLVVASCLSMVSCKGNSENPANSIEVTQTESNPIGINPTDRLHLLAELTAQVRMIGRTHIKKSGIACDFTASGIEFEATINGELYLSVNSTHNTYFTLFVDGVRQEKRLFAAAGMKKILVGTYSATETHVFRILKQTEALRSRCILQNLEFEGTVNTMPAERELYIEFLGDSITSGLGNLLTTNDTSDGSDPRAAVYADGTMSYAFLASEALNADATIISNSGIGVFDGLADFEMDDFYAAESYWRDPDLAYDFSKARNPDVVVIMLGTNDRTVNVGKADFQSAARSLVETIRKNYKQNTPIVWCYGLMEAATGAMIEELFDQMGGASAGLYTQEFQADKSGGVGHPSLVGHKAAGEALAAKLQEILNLIY